MPSRPTNWQRAAAILERQHGVITRPQILAAGIASTTVHRRVEAGTLVRVHPGVYRMAGARWSAEGALMAACLATGGWASHRSAAWLWGLRSDSPLPPSVSVPPGKSRDRAGLTIHRCAPGALATPGRLRRIPCTSVPRTLLDLAATTTEDELDAALDVALARRIVSVEAVLTEAERTVHRHRPGTARLRACLRRQGLVGAPTPSVLESKALRLLVSAGVTPLTCEQRVDVDGVRYRLDITLAPGLALEVDGFVYHGTPEAQHYDHQRRNRLLLAGWRILVYTWIDITRDRNRVIAEIRQAMDDL